MRLELQRLPTGWAFEMNEISVGVYKLCGRHDLGSQIEHVGTDPDDLIRKATSDAHLMNEEIEKARLKLETPGT